ncbi:carboxylesterase/lipase family protein [Tomitella biformata]|uniref:carboxylesterase/lipase family protein n=1 Tax=Tomitella biformata TaxID=630403 RepID=UPI000571DCA9|nr:carboxylesterase/lipase family protein [Tomitella biformata]
MPHRLSVQTLSGPVRGFAAEGVHVWKGIPFAAAPVGERRFRSPAPPFPWTAPMDCLEFGPVCPQAEGMAMEAVLQPDEDCLNLNVWRPATEGPPRPVMVWIHGGAYYMGAGSQGVYDGAELARHGEVVVVTFNYRLGTLGFVDLTSLATPEHPFESNLGLRDQIAALGWVRDNIAAFGGDPGNVTVFGESSGGGSVTTLMTVPSAEGLFHQAIAQSSPATSIYGRDRAATVARLLLDRLGLTPDQVGELRRIPVDRLARASAELATEVFGSVPGTLAIAPVVDRDLIPYYPVAAFQKGKQHKIPLLIGTNRDEATIFRLLRLPMMPVTPDSVYRMLAKIIGDNPEVSPEQIAAVIAGYPDLPRAKGAIAISQDAAFRMPALWIASAHSKAAPTWLYRFDFATPMLRAARVGAGHAMEIPYIFGTFGAIRRDPTFLLGGRAAAMAVSERIQARWAAFARDGKLDWPAYDQDGRHTLLIGREESVAADPDREMRLLWGEDVVGFS